MVKYKWNLGMGGFWGLVVKREDYHAYLKKSSTQIKIKKKLRFTINPPPAILRGRLCPLSRGSHIS